MSDRSNFPEFEEDATIVGSNLLPQQPVHPANTNPFVQQSSPVEIAPENIHSEATMVAGAPDLHSEKTQVLGGHLLVPIAKLYVQEGVQKDKSYPIAGDSVSFGREKDNAISHPDLSVSRKHFIIHNKNGKFHLEDLGSSGGTLINNKKVSGTQRLQHGDRIQVGKTLLQFQMLDENQADGSNVKIIVAALVGILLILGVVGSILLQPSENKKHDANIVTKRREPQPQRTAEKPKASQAQSFIEQGLNFKTQLDWRKAKLSLQQATNLAPESFKAMQLLKEVDAEARTDFNLRKADAKRLQGLSKEAFETLKKTASILAPGSVYADKVWSLLIKLEPKPKVIEPEPRRRRRRRWRRRKRRRAVAQVKKEPKTALWFYKQGDWKTAASMFSQKRRASKARAVRDFFKVFDQGRQAYREWDTPKAIKPLLKAYNADLKISGSQSVYTQQLKAMLANMFCSQAMDWLNRPKGKKPNYLAAFAQFRKATMYNPNHPTAQKHIKKFSLEAEAHLEKAKHLLKSNPTEANLWIKRILDTTSRIEKVNRQARKLLKQ